MRYILFYLFNFFYGKIYLILNNYKNAVLLYCKMDYGFLFLVGKLAKCELWTINFFSSIYKLSVSCGDFCDRLIR